MVQNLDEKAFKEKIFDYTKGDDAPLLINKNTIIEFWVTWFPHCQAMIPRYEQFSTREKGIDCYRVEMEEHPSIAEIFDIECFPSFVFINPDGKMSKWAGEVSEQQLEELAQQYF